MEHGGAIDLAAKTFGGHPQDWLDLSTGINPNPYPVGTIDQQAWQSLPDTDANDRLVQAARSFWKVPDDAAILPTHGASAAISRLPDLIDGQKVCIPSPTYSEHAAAFRHAGWENADGMADAHVAVHPNNPDGRLWRASDLPAARLTVIDESFCDTCPEASLIHLSGVPGHIVLKSFGKFWGLAGVRLGFAIGDPDLISRLAKLLGPWSVSGPALDIGVRALTDQAWAEKTRKDLTRQASRMDQLLTAKGFQIVGGTTLFRLAAAENAQKVHEHLAQSKVLTRVFDYSTTFVRFGLPGNEADWSKLEQSF